MHNWVQFVAGGPLDSKVLKVSDDWPSQPVIDMDDSDFGWRTLKGDPRSFTTGYYEKVDYSDSFGSSPEVAQLILMNPLDTVYVWRTRPLSTMSIRKSALGALAFCVVVAWFGTVIQAIKGDISWAIPIGALIISWAMPIAALSIYLLVGAAHGQPTDAARERNTASDGTKDAVRPAD